MLISAKQIEDPMDCFACSFLGMLRYYEIMVNWEVSLLLSSNRWHTNFGKLHATDAVRIQIIKKFPNWSQKNSKVVYQCSLCRKTGLSAGKFIALVKVSSALKNPVSHLYYLRLHHDQNCKSQIYSLSIWAVWIFACRYTSFFYLKIGSKANHEKQPPFYHFSLN